ncbi:GNAT family N-acetyltransferase [Aeromicrobium duanguangcaii]|uniref:GNAT family N-acetyltransferase n=1 Tax=Aeromicrobium duanguangcaii TaxID=2968086 RepID=A0ABY5KCS4_9ACTN|nr:GNAT family N-acetyltransferase [Aeromicrobium duanguangcaii]MCD9154911.1 GNAT family N-acetyltransferase [Aeromicrobium duanguangcaii]UUI67680.1 GNAT family N-acetyltransferase [Aeromicrobium duanguangcaii]
MPDTNDSTLALPELPSPWRARVPGYADIGALVELRRLDELQGTGEAHVDPAGIESEVAGQASWTRRQLVAVGPDDIPRAWITVHDRAAGRALIWGYFDRDVPEIDEIAAVFYAWAESAAVAMARFRGVEATRLDESPFADDTRQAGWLTEAGYAKRRTWLHMTRPATADEASLTPREGVMVRPVERHENGMPVASDLQIVHQMLETSFQDHFNSYRESFSEFVQRLREDPGHSWDHWWLAYVETDEGAHVPAGTVVCSSQAAPEGGTQGTYVEYIGVNRAARGRGVAKSLLATVIADAARHGRDRVTLEVDADSPTKADELYRSLGWETEYVTESWFKDLDLSD